MLCIEDDRSVLELLQIIFEQEGYHWVGAFGGCAGLRTAQTLKPDLILLDIMMPDMNGWEVYARVKSDVKLRHIPIMILTVRDAQWDKRLALQGAQVADYVTKPFTPDDLIQRARQVLGT
ncbi:MAG: response regulator [Chloroflexota bacterium]|nr:response regulator [Chloroflexota bacterium]